MAEPHLDNPGDVTWFDGYGPLPVVGPCPHDCDHAWGLATVAWGPDHEHYSLNECKQRGGCEGACRGWSAEYPAGRRPPWFSRRRPKFRLGRMLQVAPTPPPGQDQGGAE